MHLWKQKFWAQKCRKLVFSSLSTLFVKPNRQIIVWMQLVILWMGSAEGTFDFDLESKKRSSLETILDKNSYTFNWIPLACIKGCSLSYVPRVLVRSCVCVFIFVCIVLIYNNGMYCIYCINMICISMYWKNWYGLFYCIYHDSWLFNFMNNTQYIFDLS